MVQTTDEPLWSTIATRMLVNTISHPIEFAKVLIQIGHEPIPPKPTTTLFGYPALGLPSIFQYVKYIKKVDGFTGCYRGLVPKFCAYTISTIAVDKTSGSIVFDDEPNKEIDEDHLSNSERKKRYIYELLRDVASRVVGIIVSHPLDVIALRSMAQFVGGETKYNGLFRSIYTIYSEDGIFGYYTGIIPRLLANVATLVMVSGSTYAINKYIIRDREINIHTGSIMTFLCATITYPLHVVSHCMMVNNCGLAAGIPPYMPIYANWVLCWSHLSAMNQLTRGSSMLWRYAPKPKEPDTQVKTWGQIKLLKR